MSIDNKKINLDSSNIFKISETVEYIAILHSKINNEYENIINLLLYDKFTQEIFNIDIIDYIEIEELNLDIKILNDFIYVLYQDKEKIFILKYEIGFEELNLVDLSENYEDFYLNNFINIDYSLYLHEKYIYFFYLNSEKRFILYKIGTNLNIVTEFEDESLSLELYFYVKDKTFMLIDILNNYYLSIDKYGKYNKISNYNLDNIVTSNNNYEKKHYAYTQLFSKELCLGYYKNIIFLRMNKDDNKVSINIDNSDENENLVLDLDRNSTNKLELFVDNEKKINLFESSKNIDVYKFEIINNYLIIVYSDEELDKIYNLKNISIINLDNYRRVDYINKFQKCYFLEKNLFLCNFRKYNNKNSLTIKKYNLSSDELEKENTYDFKINENIDFISKCNYKIMFLVNNGESDRNINNKSNLYFYDNVEIEDDYSYMWSSKELKKANRDLKAKYDETKKYYTIDNLKSNGNDILVLGLGTYIIEGISFLYPISFDISNNSNIRFSGLGSNLFMIKQKINKLKGDKESLAEDNIFEYPHYPFRREDSNQNYIYFYYGTVKLVVTGEFDEIPGYYIYDTENDEISTNSIIPFKIKFESTSIPGYSNDRQLEIDELNSRKNYIFYHNGTSDNGVRVKGFDKKGFSLETDKNLKEEYQDETYFSYVEPYCDDITDCLYIRSNGIPNYIPFTYNNTTGLEEMEVSSFGTDINGLDRQAYSYVSNSRRIFGFPFKIPLNPQLTDLKNIPNDIRYSEEQIIQKESFWYRSDENWDKIMVNTGYSNFKIGNTGPTSLLPIGQIGVAVNGVPFHSPATMKNTILETPITANLSIKDPVVKRTLKKNNAPLEGIVDETSNSIFDNYGGSVDKNSVYNYKRYPINLEADIVLGTIGYDETSLMLDPNSTSEEKINYYINTQRKKINDMLKHEDSNIIVIDIDNHEKTKFLKINLSDTSLKNISKLKLISSEIVEHTPTYSINSPISFSRVQEKFSVSFGVTITENDHIKDIINTDYLKEYINYNGTQGEEINPHILIELTPEILHSFGYDNSGTGINNKIILKFGVEGSQVFELHISGNNNDTTKINYLKYLKYNSNLDPEFKLYESKFTYEDDGESKTYEYNGILETDEKKKKFLDFMKKNNIHSPILGWSFDGFPIYGQIGYKKETLFKEVKFLGSSYKETKKYLQKTEIGVDNKITDVTGDLDLCNGIFLSTPEFPDGIYHYVCTVNLNGNEVIFDGNELEYQYPYVIGAYKALPEVSNFALLPSDTNLSNSTDNTVSSSSYGTSTSTSSGTTNSSTVVSETQNYSIKFRSIKADTYNYNSNQYRSIGISQDDDFIKIHATPKPYIWNLSGNKNSNPDAKFGLDNEIFGAADNSITQLFNNDNVYGDVYKFKINGTVTVKQAVRIYSDDNNLSVTNISKSDEPILGICVGKEEDDYAYIMTRGICEFTGISLHMDKPNIYYDGDNLVSLIPDDNGSFYIAGTLVRKSSASNEKNYIYVNPQYLEL